MSMSQGGIAVFVNTSDGFTDCWEPFFELWRTYAADLKEIPIYLNTERVGYDTDGLNVRTTRVWPEDESQRPTWSACLDRGLTQITEEQVLYLQEDYFLTQPLRADWITRASALLDAQPQFDAVYLNKYGPQFAGGPAIADGFVAVSRRSKYLLSTQAALWRRDALRAHIQCWENGWMFEKFGTWRAARAGRQFASVAPKIMHEQPVIDYIYTGVMKGKWHGACPALFDAHGIDVDFSRRDFYRSAGPLKTKFEVVRKLASDPRLALRSARSVWTAKQ